MKAPACALIAAALALPARAANIVEAEYDAARDRIEVEIAYRGTRADHDFRVQWGNCSEASPPRLVARLVDRHGADAAREDYRTTERIALDGMPCRPAIVTLRLGRVSHTDVFVPQHIELLSGMPARPYEEVGRIAAYGEPGEQRGYVYQELRSKARALGADAVARVEEDAERVPLPPAEAGDAPLLGAPYPGALGSTQPGALPQYGFDVQTGGVRYEVRGIAVRYTGAAD